MVSKLYMQLGRDFDDKDIPGALKLIKELADEGHDFIVANNKILVRAGIVTTWMLSVDPLNLDMTSRELLVYEDTGEPSEYISAMYIFGGEERTKIEINTPAGAITVNYNSGKTPKGIYDPYSGRNTGELMEYLKKLGFIIW